MKINHREHRDKTEDSEIILNNYKKFKYSVFLIKSSVTSVVKEIFK